MNTSILFFLLIFRFMIVLSLEKRSFQRKIKFRRNILWESTNLKYAIFGNIANLDQTRKSVIKRVVSEAFREWQENSCFIFKGIKPSSLADIKIIFTNDEQKSENQQNSILPNFFHKKQCEFRIKGNF